MLLFSRSNLTNAAEKYRAQDVHAATKILTQLKQLGHPEMIYGWTARRAFSMRTAVSRGPSFKFYVGNNKFFLADNYFQTV